MTLEDAERQALIQYRIDKAYGAVEEVEFLLKNEKFTLAVNRVYYGLFYVLSALALKHRFKTSKHGQLIGWFNKNFVKEKLIDQRYSKILYRAFESRIHGDYIDFTEFTRDEVTSMVIEMKDFINTVNNLLMDT